MNQFLSSIVIARYFQCLEKGLKAVFVDDFSNPYKQEQL